MAFKLAARAATIPESPELLFRDLRNRKVEGLLSQQADILRRYMDKGRVDAPDVALQMHTGSGKTLVGLLIAEWRRRKYQHRAVYLCPTNQLVNQVVEQSVQKYGLRTLAFTGPKSGYSPAAKSEYLNAEAVAVTNYSSLFNTSPFFDHAQFILLDDSHAGENYIGDFFSLLIEKGNSDHASLFETLTLILRENIRVADMARLQGESGAEGDKQWVDMLPAVVLYEKHDELFQAFATYCVSGTPLSYKWQILQDHLKACHLYFGYGKILVRPLIFPSKSHRPFAKAVQRVYMSATFGEGGELERVMGEGAVSKIPALEGWDKQGIGRRLFFFPMKSMEEKESDQLIMQMIVRAERALVLTPSDQEENAFRELVTRELPQFTLFDAGDLESSKNTFVSTQKAVAVVANRYDGIDLIGDECRLLILRGHSRAMNLQEQFLMSRMAAGILYNDRIRTRITQATGRCTRSATDYAAVVVLGEQLNRFLLQLDTRQYLHPELQAEIEFGIEESREQSREGFLDNLKILYEHKEVWDKVDEHIIGERDKAIQQPLPCVSNFLGAVPNEVAYQYALWNEDYIAALESARRVLTTIQGPEELRGYRAFWMYLAGNAAWLAWKAGTANLETVAKGYYRDASKAAKGVPWMHNLAVQTQSRPESSDHNEGYFDDVIERLETNIESWGMTHDRAFERVVKKILEGLDGTTAGPFEIAQMQLGKLLGFEAYRSDEASAPDPWWILNERTGIVFEDYTDCQPDAVVPTAKIRQALSHPKWLESQVAHKTREFAPDMVTPAKKLGGGARPHASGVFYLDKADFVAWAKNAIGVVRDIRRSYPGLPDLTWRALAKEAYKRNGLDPAGILAKVKEKQLTILPDEANH